MGGSDEIIGDLATTSSYSDQWRRHRELAQGASWDLIIAEYRRNERVPRKLLLYALKQMESEIADRDEIVKSALEDNQRLRRGLRHISKLDENQGTAKTAKRIALGALGETVQWHPSDDLPSLPKARQRLVHRVHCALPDDGESDVEPGP